MAALDPAVAAIRGALRRTPPPAEPGALVLVACSGGPDSMALAAAARFVLPRMGLRAGLVTVDHQLQPGSADRAGTLAEWARGVGLDPVVVATVDVAGRPGGPEAAARDVRYEALASTARAHDCAAVLLGHTREDQAETVLLALVRGSGGRGLAGMPVRRRRHGVGFVRPLLDISRDQTRAACLAQALPVWHDPHNADPAYRRTHARALLASLVDHLGPSVVGNLARTAKLAAADGAALDHWTARATRRASRQHGPENAGACGLDVVTLAGLPEAVRTRVLHRWALSLDAPGSALSYRHVMALDALVTAWRGQGPVSLPGGVEVVRRDGYLVRADMIVQPYGRDMPRAVLPVRDDEARLSHG